jgi:hypothetical protein
MAENLAGAVGQALGHDERRARFQAQAVEIPVVSALRLLLL